MTRSLSACTLLAAVACLGGCGKAEFKPFSSAEGKFSCEFPGTPKTQTQSVAGATMYTFSVEERNRAYMVAYADMPIPPNESAAQTQDRLDGSRDGMLGNVGGVKTGESKIELNGKYPGREILADIPSKSGAIRARVYLVGTRLYQVAIVGKKGFEESADTLRFLNSLKLTQ